MSPLFADLDTPSTSYRSRFASEEKVRMDVILDVPLGLFKVADSFSEMLAPSLANDARLSFEGSLVND